MLKDKDILTPCGLPTDTALLHMARSAWLALAPMRKRRARCKDFTYGRQWGDSSLTQDGELLTDGELLARQGRTPITNNLIRQLLNTVIGRYRHMTAQGDGDVTGVLRALSGPVGGTDARALEEFLISGIVVQRLHGGGCPPENISPERLAFLPFREPHARDCRFVALLHDITVPEALERFAQGDARRARAVGAAMRRTPLAEISTPLGHAGSFETADTPLHHRVLEVWDTLYTESLQVTDPENGTVSVRPLAHLERVEALNSARAQVGTRPLQTEYRVQTRWRGTWLTPSGHVLARRELPQGHRPPVAMHLHPLIDGEVHSMVEDIIDQQKYVNRLISTIDHILSSSAKGVLLYPAEQLPDGFSWRDLRRIWANPTGILPFKRSAKGTVVPQQVQGTAGATAAAHEMLRTQLGLFDQISGTQNVLRGDASPSAGQAMYRAQTENALIALLDILSSFREFTLRRDERLQNDFITD